MNQAKQSLAMAMGLWFAAASPGVANPGWSYDGIHDGQDAWGMLSPEFSACETGTRQSPVVIAYTQPAPMPAMRFSYHEGQATARFHEHAAIIDIPPSSTLSLGDDLYELKRIRFHTPSEHVVREKFFPLEIHLVHERADGKLLILALFAQSGGATHESLDTAQRHFSKKAEASTPFSFNPATLLPDSFGYYAYNGSLSAPPCTEGVEWRVFKTPIRIASAQMESIAEFMGRNARLEQPVYGRTIHETNY